MRIDTNYFSLAGIQLLQQRLMLTCIDRGEKLANEVLS